MSVWEGMPARSAEPVRRTQILLYAALAGLVVVLGLARLVTGPWYHTYNPVGVMLLEGWPAAWEVVYYLVHFPTFLGDVPAQFAIAPVHYRTFLNLYLATALYGWTGSAFWSLAAVDLLFWFLAAVAGYHLALRLGAGPRAATLGALMLAASPLLISNMWRHDLHVANFATMALGVWAALALVDEHRDCWRLALGLAVLLLLLSLSYQYHWFMVPLLGVLVVANRRLTLRQGIIVVVGAVLIFLAGTVVLKAVLTMAGLGSSVGYIDAVAQPGRLLATRLAGIRSAADVAALLPRWPHLQLMAQAYHPVVFVSGLIGLALLSWRARWMGLLTLAGSLFAITLHGPPWIAMTAYPFIYAGAGVSCAAAGALVARAAALPGRRRGAARWHVWLATAVGGSLAAGFMALTNLDLMGNPQFLLWWWNSYATVGLF